MGEEALGTKQAAKGGHNLAHWPDGRLSVTVNGFNAKIVPTANNARYRPATGGWRSPARTHAYLGPPSLAGGGANVAGEPQSQAS